MYKVSGTDPSPPPPDFNPTVFKVQLYFCITLGSIIFLIFCLTRYKFPLVYSVRSYRNLLIKRLPDNFFGWIKVLIFIPNEEFLQVAGLDAYVFLRFFSMGIKIFFTMAILGVFILTPLRYIFTGKIDKEIVLWKAFDFISGLDNDYSLQTPAESGGGKGGGNSEDNDPESILLIATLFTYVFTAIVFYYLFKETRHVIRTRQRCLGVQKSLTDRTIYISNIPDHLIDENRLQQHIETLGVGKVSNITLMHDYSQLKELFDKRKQTIKTLEQLYSNHYGLHIKILTKRGIPSTTLKFKNAGLEHYYSSDSVNSQNPSDSTPLLRTLDIKNSKVKKSAPMVRLSTFGPKVDAFEHFARELIDIDQEIVQLKREENFKPLSKAFVTMESVSDAQMAAQAIFSPNVFQLITSLAPAPMDVNWDNLLLSAKSVFIRKNLIEVLSVIFSALLIIPIRYISSLLNVSTIKKMWPEFGEYLIKHELIRSIVTGLVPTYLFTLINVALPYVISFLSNLQGIVSKGDVELSVIRKNFLYIFFNLFLVFTLFGTLSSYKALLSDTTKIAPLLATSIKGLSIFYVDLILLQGLVMFPFKLLQIGDLAFIFWQYIMCYSYQTPRAYRDLFYKPAIFDIGLILPQHLMIFIITIIYSVISTKILTSGLIYFILGYYVYKYQLVYSMVHLQHSTGKAWPLIFRRVCLGVFFLQLTMFGTLALEHSFVLAALITPLFPATVIALMFFDRNYLPLLFYIALDAIKTSGQSVEAEDYNNTVLTFADDTIDDIGHTISNALGNSISGPGTRTPQHDDIEEEEEEEEEGGTREYGSDQIYEDQTEETQHLLPRQLPPNKLNNCNIPSDLLPMLRKRRSTIDEEREEFQSYTYPALVDPMDGPWIGFVGDYIDTVEYYLNVDHNEGVSATESGDEILSVVKRRKNTTVEYD